MNTKTEHGGSQQQAGYIAPVEVTPSAGSGVQWGGRSLTAREADVLAHTASNGRYVTDEAAVIEMGKAGLLQDHGPQNLAAGMHYLTMTHLGRMMLMQWRDAQPKPKPLTKAQLRYRDFLDVDCGLTFIEWLRGRRGRGAWRPSPAEKQYNDGTEVAP